MAAEGDRNLAWQLSSITVGEPEDVDPLMGPRVDITLETVNTAARNFATGQHDLEIRGLEKMALDNPLACCCF